MLKILLSVFCTKVDNLHWEDQNFYAVLKHQRKNVLYNIKHFEDPSFKALKDNIIIETSPDEPRVDGINEFFYILQYQYVDSFSLIYKTYTTKLKLHKNYNLSSIILREFIIAAATAFKIIFPKLDLEEIKDSINRYKYFQAVNWQDKDYYITQKCADFIVYSIFNDTNNLTIRESIEDGISRINMRTVLKTPKYKVHFEGKTSEIDLDFKIIFGYVLTRLFEFHKKDFKIEYE